MPTELVDVEDFLGHSGASRGGGQILDWKEKGHADVWLHRHCSFSVAVWRHPFLRYVVVEDEETREPVKVLRFTQLLCPESEDVLKMQGRHSKQSGELLVPYELCPMHKFLEWVYQQVATGQMHWLEEVLRFEGQSQGGQDVSRTLHATGLFNGFKGDLISPEKWKEANKVGIYKKGENGAFKENWMAGLNYIFRVVDNDFVKEGVQIAIVPQSVGDHTKIRVREMMQAPPKGLGKEMGNPLRNPYCIEWQHHPDEKEPNKQYSAMAIDPTRMPPSQEVMRLIDETEPPSIDHLTAPPAWAAVRATLERAALVDIPWDDFFPQEEDPEADDKKLQQRSRVPDVGRPAAPQRQAAGPQRQAAPQARPAAPRMAPAPQGRANPQPGTQAAPRGTQAAPRPAPRPTPPTPAAEVERVRCDNPECDNILLLTETFCAVCGMRFDQPEPAPEPAPLRRRSEAANGATTRMAPQPETRVSTPQRAAPSAPRSQARQPVTSQRRAPASGFDEFPHGANVPEETGELEDTGLAPDDQLPWGRR